MSILVWNPTDRPIHLQSFDRDSVLIGPKAKGVEVSQKFNWNPPSELKIKDLGEDVIDPNKIVKGPMPYMHRKPPRAHNKSVRVSTNRAEELIAGARQKRAQKEATAQLKAMQKAAETSQ